MSGSVEDEARSVPRRLAFARAVADRAEASGINPGDPIPQEIYEAVVFDVFGGWTDEARSFAGYYGRDLDPSSNDSPGLP